VYFEPAYNNPCTINANAVCRLFEIATGYTNTITQGAFTVTVGVEGFQQHDGVFNGSASAITINGPYVQDGGTFKSTSGTLTHNAATWTSNTGTPTFNANGGTVTFNRTHDNTVTVASGSMRFNNVTLAFSGGTGSIGVTGTMYVDGTLTLADRDVYANGGITSGTIEVGGNLTMAASYWGLRSTGLIKMTGTGSQTISTTGTSTFPPIEVAKSAGTLVLSGANSASGWTWTSGTLDASGSTLTVVDPYNVPITVTPGAVSYNNVGINVSGSSTIVTISGTWDVNGNLALDIRDQYGSCKVNSGTINVAGNLAVSYGTSSGWGASTAAIVMDGTGTINATSGVPCASLTINTAGTASLAANASIGTVAVTNGTLNLAGYNLSATTLTIGASGTLKLQGGETVTTPTSNSGTVAYTGTTATVKAWSYTNLTINKPGGTYSFTGGSTYNVSGTLTFTGAAGNLLTLQSTDANAWNINPSGSRAVDYVNVSKSNNTNATAIAATNSTNGGGNTNWTFS
jgi:hypothetical protein